MTGPAEVLGLEVGAPIVADTYRGEVRGRLLDIHDDVTRAGGPFTVIAPWGADADYYGERLEVPAANVRPDPSPRPWELPGWSEFDEVPNRRTGIAYLVRDGGHLAAPCSRYGRNSEECAPVAWRLAYLMARETGEPITYYGLEHDMGLVVNDSDEVAYLVRNYGRGDYGRAIR